MRGTKLKDWQWVAEVEYESCRDSKIVFPGVDAPDILSAIAKVVAMVRDCWPYEIISIRQEEVK